MSRNGVSLSSTVRAISLSGCSRLTDRGLALVARRCHLLQVCLPQTSKIYLRVLMFQNLFDTVLIQELEIQACPLVTNGGLLDLTSRCHHLNHLDVQVKRIPDSSSFLFLKIISPHCQACPMVSAVGLAAGESTRHLAIQVSFHNNFFYNIYQITSGGTFGKQALETALSVTAACGATNVRKLPYVKLISTDSVLCLQMKKR